MNHIVCTPLVTLSKQNPPIISLHLQMLSLSVYTISLLLIQYFGGLHRTGGLGIIIIIITIIIVIIK